MLVDGRWKHLCKLISATMALLERVTVSVLNICPVYWWGGGTGDMT